MRPGATFRRSTSGLSVYYRLTAGGKKVRFLDLKTPKGRAALDGLLGEGRRPDPLAPARRRPEALAFGGRRRRTASASRSGPYRGVPSVGKGRPRPEFPRRVGPPRPEPRRARPAGHPRVPDPGRRGRGVARGGGRPDRPSRAGADGPGHGGDGLPPRGKPRAPLVRRRRVPGDGTRGERRRPGDAGAPPLLRPLPDEGRTPSRGGLYRVQVLDRLLHGHRPAGTRPAPVRLGRGGAKGPAAPRGGDAAPDASRSGPGDSSRSTSA